MYLFNKSIHTTILGSFSNLFDFFLVALWNTKNPMDASALCRFNIIRIVRLYLDGSGAHTMNI